MQERERLRMQHLASNHTFPDFRYLRPAVHPVAEYGMADMRQMDADLVRTAGLDLHLDQRRVPEPFLDLEERDRLARLVRVDADPFPLLHVPAEPDLYRAGPFFDPPGNQRNIAFLHDPVLKLPGKRAERFPGPGHDHHSGGILVQP